MRICLATNNAHKIKEIQEAVGTQFQFVSLADIGCNEELPETESTISGNSLQKARYVFDHYNIASLADDSGLEVLALKGEPGVDSAHYAGPQRSHSDNINLLLKNLDGVSARDACFKTVLTLILSTGTMHQFTGILEGTIISEQKGNEGFGYDPVFVPKGSEKTLAEITLSEKNKISHRSKAVRQLMGFLKSASTDLLL